MHISQSLIDELTQLLIDQLVLEIGIVRTGELCNPGYADMVAGHYGRFLPQDNAALAARILNQVWMEV